MKRVQIGLAFMMVSFMIPAMAEDFWFVINKTNDPLTAIIETASGTKEIQVAPAGSPGDTQQLQVSDAGGRTSIMTFKITGPGGKATVVYKNNKPTQLANTDYFKYPKLGDIMTFTIEPPKGTSLFASKKNYKIKGFTENSPEWPIKLTP